MTPDGDFITEDWEMKNRAAAKRKASKIEFVGNFQFYEYSSREVFYYKPRFKQ